jgi:hypothetical protein
MTRASLIAEVVLAPGVLSEVEAAALRSIRCDSGENVAASLIGDLVTGRAKLAHVKRNEHKIGFVVFTVSPEHELTVNAAFGYDGRENLVSELIGDSGLILSLADQSGCETVAFSTARPGLVRRALEHGFRASEVVMRKALR